jgi:hypothetical protein
MTHCSVSRGSSMGVTCSNAVIVALHVMDDRGYPSWPGRLRKLRSLHSSIAWQVAQCRRTRRTPRSSSKRIACPAERERRVPRERPRDAIVAVLEYRVPPR